MDIGDNVMGIGCIALKLGNDGMGVRDAMMDFGNSQVCIYYKFGLKMKG